MKSIIIFLAFSVVLISCSRDKSVEAKIFERREVEGNKLMIKYTYTVDNKQYADSSTIENVIIDTEKVQVKFHPSTPQKAVLLLPK